MAEKKKQHFVPQLLLRNFSEDKTTINSFLVDKNKRLDGISLRDQCQKNYLYGKDGVVEDMFGELETEFSKLLNLMIDSNSLQKLDEEQDQLIRTYINLQAQRTPKAAEEQNILTDGMMKSILTKDRSFGDIDFDKLNIHLTQPVLHTIYVASTNWPILLDFRIRLLRNNTDVDFFISDHPVVIYNSWAENHPKFSKWPGSHRGLALKGIKILFPISPKDCLILYDDKTYKIPPRKGLIAEIINPKDIIEINKLQICMADNCIYFKSENLGKSLFEYTAFRNKYRSSLEPKVTETKPVRKPDGKMSSLIITDVGTLKAEFKSSSIKIMDKHHYEEHNHAGLPIRSYELVQMASDYHKYIQKKSESDNNE